MSADAVLSRLLIDIAILLAVSQVLRLVLAPLRQPDVIAYVLAGFVLGPSLLGNLPFDPSTFLFPDQVRSGLSVIGSLGLVVFAFAIGLDLNLDAVRRQSRSVLNVSVGALTVPLVAGALLALVLYPAHRRVGGIEVPRLAFVLFLATAMAVTAFPVLVAIVSERGIRDSPLGRLAVSSAAVQDAVGWTLLATALAALSGGGSDLVQIVVETVGFLLALALARPLLRLVLARAALGGPGGEIGVLAIALGFAAACAGATQAIGLHLVVGAFAAGVAFPRDLPRARVPTLVEAVMPFTMALLMPIYFLGPGLGVDVGAIGPGGFVELGAIVLIACASKLAGGTLAARYSGMPWAEAWVLGVLLNTRGLMELVVLTVGYTEEVLDRALYSELVIMALVTTMMTGPLLDLLSRRRGPVTGPAPRGGRLGAGRDVISTALGSADDQAPASPLRHRALPSGDRGARDARAQAAVPPLRRAARRLAPAGALRPRLSRPHGAGARASRRASGAGSLAIARALETLAPLPSLYPAEPRAQAAAEEAELWAEAVLQPIPRRLIRWGLRHSLRQRQWFAATITALPAPGLLGIALTPVVPVFTWQSGASEERVRRDLDELPSLLDRVDRLLADGVIGREDLGAADFQIAASVRVLVAMEDVGHLVVGRPAETFARRVVPEFPDVPATLPPAWLP